MVGFTYSLGNDVVSAAELMRDIACDMNGVWTAVKDGGDLRYVFFLFYVYVFLKCIVRCICMCFAHLCFACYGSLDSPLASRGRLS